jgi:hypothetical protein
MTAMSIKQRRLFEMLNRVDHFGHAHTDVFPPRSTGGQLFKALRDALACLTTRYIGPVSRGNQARDGFVNDGAARDELQARLRALCRTARSLAIGAPEGKRPFRLPRRGGDEGLIVAARAMAADARRSKGRFAAYGLHLDDLDRAIAAFERACADRAERRRARGAASKDLAAALARAFSIVRRLDAVVTNVLADAVPPLEEWRRARRVVRRRRGARRVIKRRAAPVADVVLREVPGRAQ